MDDQGDSSYARAPEPEDLITLCRALNASGARYVLIGGFKEGLSVLPDNAAAEVADTDVQTHVVVRVADEIIVDLMGRACGLSYADVKGDAEVIRLEDVDVPVASPSTLIRTKDTYREQDKLDRAFLEELLRRRR